MARQKVLATIEIATRALCTCGEKMGRAKSGDTETAACLRILTGNNPSLACQTVPASKLLWGPVPPVKEEAED